MEYPLKIKIIHFLIRKLEANQDPLKLEYSLQEIADATGEYKPSISREIRNLKDMKIITYECINKKLGLYKITMTRSGNKSSQKIKERLQYKMDSLIKDIKSNKFQIKKLLNDAARNLSKMSPKSETIQP